MTSKTNSSNDSLDMLATLTPLAHVAVLEASGVDAAAFLQRQCMNDVSKLDHDGAMQWSGLLSAKGRVLFLFRLLRLAGDRYLLLAPGADAADLASELLRFVLRSKLRLVRDTWGLRGAITDSAPDEAALAWDAGRWIVLDDRAGQPDEATAANGDDLSRRWRDLDLQRGIPQISADLADRFTPQMLGLARLQAYSLTKGCYPGQEIVARTHYLGQQKREWTPLCASRALRHDEPVLGDGRELGRILQIAPGDARFGAAVLPLDGSAELRLDDGSLLTAQRSLAA